MARYATQDFRLNNGTHAPVLYKAGDKIDPKHAEHWWAKAHSKELEPEKAGKGPQRSKAQKAADAALADAEAALKAAQDAAQAEPSDAANTKVLEAAQAVAAARKAADEA